MKLITIINSQERTQSQYTRVIPICEQGASKSPSEGGGHNTPVMLAQQISENGEHLRLMTALQNSLMGAYSLFCDLSLDDASRETQLSTIYETSRKILGYQYVLLGKQNTDSDPGNSPSLDLETQVLANLKKIQILNEQIYGRPSPLAKTTISYCSPVPMIDTPIVSPQQMAAPQWIDTPGQQTSPEAADQTTVQDTENTASYMIQHFRCWEQNTHQNIVFPPQPSPAIPPTPPMRPLRQSYQFEMGDEEAVLTMAQLIYEKSAQEFPDDAEATKNLAPSERVLENFKTYRYEAAIVLSIKYNSDWRVSLPDTLRCLCNDDKINPLSPADAGALERMLLQSIHHSIPHPACDEANDSQASDEWEESYDSHDESQEFYDSSCGEDDVYLESADAYYY